MRGVSLEASVASRGGPPSHMPEGPSTPFASLRVARDDTFGSSAILFPMRKILFVLILAAFPALAQNTDIESLSGLQFNFGNPGARSLGMGGAFLGLADDASAAEANPAGLTILRKPEVSIEGRNYQEKQVFSTSGTYPDIARTAFSHYSQRVEVTFGS